MESSTIRGTISSSSALSSMPDDGSNISGDSDSSKSGTKNPNSFDPIPKPDPPQVDLPTVPVSSKTGFSLTNFDKQNEGSQLFNRNTPLIGMADADSSSFSIGSRSEMKWKSGDGSDILLEGSSPSLPSSARLRSCDVYIGLSSSKPTLLRFAKWLRAELELQGVSCFAADRSRCKNAVGHSIVERAMNSATFGVVIVSKKSFSNPYSIYELKSFLAKKNLVPIFYGLGLGDCVVMDIIGKRGELWEKHGGDLWRSYGGTSKEWKEVVNALSRMDGWKLEARSNNWRDCISETILLLGKKLGKRSVVEGVKRWKERVEKKEFPFPRNDKFVGRKRELLELELMLFGDVSGNGQSECFELKTTNKRKNSNVGRKSKSKNIEDQRKKSMGKGKEPVVWKESEEEIEMEGGGSPQRHYKLSRGKDGGSPTSRKRSTKVVYGKGIACVSGERGIGKTELLIEFAYRFTQRYRMVLWVGGEARYIRQNFMNLLPLLEVDVSIENQLCLERNKPRSFEELEEEAIRRVRKEFMRDIPFLIVIDNLEREKDWWDGRNIMELLPRFGGETHIIISTCLPRIMNLEPLRLSYLPHTEAMSLMRGRLENISLCEDDALQIIEEKLGRHTFGLSLVGGVLSELSISPQGLLDTIEKVPYRDLTWTTVEDPMLRHNPFLLQLLEVCFLILNNVDEVASRMALVSGWFAPSPIPVSLLALASKSETLEMHHKVNIWKKFMGVVTSRCLMSQTKRSEEQSSMLLVRLGFARNGTKQGYIHFHEIINLYARKRGDDGVIQAMFQAINAGESLPQQHEHIWAASFLLFKFGTNPAILKPKVSELLSFIKRLALPLALYTFANFSRCKAALELLRLCTSELEAVEESLCSQVDKGLGKLLCWGGLTGSTSQLNLVLYQELALLKATLLERRAELMLQGGEYDIGQQLCRTAISIREVFYGWDHPEMISACNTMVVRAG